MQHKIFPMVTAFALTVASVAGALIPVVARAETKPLVISAVQIAGPDGRTNDDFIELFNPNPEPANLAGYRLVKRSSSGLTDSSIKSWTTDTFIPAYSFYLWANSSFTGLSATPDFTTSSTLASDNGVALRNGPADTGTIIDSLAWGTTTNTFKSSGQSNPEPGKSIVRTDLFQESGYAIATSNPRNSSVKQLPPVVDPEPVLVDDSTCQIAEQNLEVEPETLLTANVTFTNTGTTTWDPLTYAVQNSFTSENTNLPENILPNEQLVLSFEFSAPLQTGEYQAEFSMLKSQQVFGDSCVLLFTVVEATDPDPDPDPDPEPEPQPKTIKITELLVNPNGKDDGLEQIEIYNYGQTAIDLESWVLDDSSPQTSPNSDAYILPELTIGAGQYLAIVIPAGKFVMNNTKGDTVTLFTPEDEAVDSVSYTTNSPSGKTYSLYEGKWQWDKSSLGSANLPPTVDDESNQEKPAPKPKFVDISGLEFSEVYPAPSSGDQEFLELFNSSSKSIDLSGAQILVGERKYQLPSKILSAQKYFVLQNKELKFSLSDNGKELALVDQKYHEHDQLDYPKAIKGQSYAKFSDGWQWTTKPTKSKQNEFVAPEKIQAKSATAKTSANNKAKTSSSSPKKTTTSKSSIKPQSSVTAKTTNVSSPVKSDEVASSSKPSADQEQTPTNNPAGGIAIAVATIGAGAFAVYKFGVVG